MCSQNSTTAGKRTLYTSFKSTQNNVAVTYPVGSRNALYVVGKETTLLNSVGTFTLVNTTRQYYYPKFFEELDIDIGAEVMWYLDGVISTLTLDSTSDCPTNVTFLVGVADLTYVQNNKQNISDTIANVLGIDTSRVDINTATAKRSAQQLQNFFEVTVVDGATEVLGVLNDPTAINSALTDLGLTVTGLQGSQLLGEPTPTPDGASPPLSAPSTASPAGTPVTTPADAPTDIPATPSNAVPVTPVATFPPSADISPSGVVAAPGALDSGIIVAIVVVCVVVAAAVIIIAVVVSRNKKKKSGGGSGSSRMERGSATEMKETTSAAALVTTSNPAKKDSESSDEDEESGEDVDSSDEDEESDEEESGSEVSGSGSNEGSSSAEGSGSNEGSESASGSGSEESS